LNKQDCEGLIALHVAAALGKNVLAQCLIENGASVHVEDKRGVKAIDLARKNGNEKIVFLIYGQITRETGTSAINASISNEEQLQVKRGN
jgi:hypothetical protein